MRVKFWGVRGSIPSPPSNEEIVERLVEAIYRLGQDPQWLDVSDRKKVREWVDSLPTSINSFVGGNTPCLEITFAGQTLIIDLGSGIRTLGNELMSSEFGQGRGHASLFLSHFHYDHIQGWPFFKPAYISGNRFDIYSRHEDARERLKEQQADPFFPPASWEDMVADINFHLLPDTPITLCDGQLKVSTLELDHPSTCFGFRLESNDHILVYASDGAYPLPDGTKDDIAGRYIDFFRDADMIIFDAQFSLAESMEKKTWGHSSAITGVELAARANAKKLVLFHHAPNSSDGHLDYLLRVAREYAINPPAPCKPNQVEVVMAREGMDITL
jgi:phosphoribosyl 1,2-cyclic phosphodiesterase